MDNQLIIDALNMALLRRGKPKNVILHSDRGSQYCSKDYQQLLSKNKLICSMSAKGNCYDNAVCESFFHTLKMELIYRENYDNREQAKLAIFWYIESYYNRIRKHSTLGYKSPVDYEESTIKSSE